jgi:thioredoxin-like negative regulator of GroEL
MLPRLNDKTFGAAIRSSRPIMVVFTAPQRCPHCREQKPALEEIVELGVPVYLVDVEQPDTAHIEATIGGRGVPFAKMYSNGQLLSERLGMMSASQLMVFADDGAAIAAQMGARRPAAVAGPRQTTQVAPVRPARVEPPLHEEHPDVAMADPVRPVRREQPAIRAQGYRSLRGLLAGFGRE